MPRFWGVPTAYPRCYPQHQLCPITSLPHPAGPHGCPRHGERRHPGPQGTPCPHTSKSQVCASQAHRTFASSTPPPPPRLPELRQLWLPCLEPSPHWCPGSTPKHMAARAVPVHELGHVPALIKASTGNKTQSPPGSGSPVSHLHLLPRSRALASRAASRSLCLRAFAHADPSDRLPLILTQTLLL